MDDLEQWPPVWKPYEECPEFEIYQHFNIPGPPSRFNDTRTLANLVTDAVVIFRDKPLIEQLRDTRGYDIEVLLFGSISSYFMPLSHLNLATENRYFVPEVYCSCQGLTDKINERAQAHSKSYELLGIETYVRVLGRFKTNLITCRVKELETDVVKTIQGYVYVNQRQAAREFFVHVKEWRFKPN